MIQEYQLIETILADYKIILKNDFSVYRNHIYRIFNYALLLDTNKNNTEKYAIAAVFHDIGIWTHSFDYLKPSIALATEYLNKNNHQDWIEEVSLMIDNHHKMSVYKGKYEKTVEVFRISDLIDVSNGLKKFNIPKQDFSKIQKAFTNNGFHLFLAKQSLKWFIKHPFNPLPMFKR